jgi:peptide/nickel transport system permease protein
LLSLPGLAILLLVSTIYTPGPDGLALVIAVISWTGIARLIRGEVLSLRNRDFIDAARIIGASDARIIVRHIFPNVIPIIVVWISLAIPGLILTEAALSFLGFGVQIPTPSWGNMLEEASGFFTQSWWNVFLPGFLIYITVLAVNLVGIGLRDALDPRLNY